MLKVAWIILEICTTIGLDFIFPCVVVIYKKKKVFYIIFNFITNNNAIKMINYSLHLAGLIIREHRQS